jgi:hypothetical protein
MLVKFYDIQWDTDGEDVDLPREAIMAVDGDPAMDGADALSNWYGWCVEGFSYAVLEC